MGVWKHIDLMLNSVEEEVSKLNKKDVNYKKKKHDIIEKMFEGEKFNKDFLYVMYYNYYEK